MSLKSVNAFLETKFGFWVVTTILAGAATTLNAFLQTSFTERQRASAQIRKLDLEVEYRISGFMVALSQIANHKAKPWKLKDGYDAADLKVLTQALVGSPKSVKDLIFLSMYPKDFGDRPLASLMAELQSELKSPDALNQQLAYVSGGKLFEGDDWKGRNFEDVFTLASDVNKNLL